MRDFRKKIVKNREMFLRSIALLFMDIAIIIISMGGERFGFDVISNSARLTVYFWNRCMIICS